MSLSLVQEQEIPSLLPTQQLYLRAIEIEADVILKGTRVDGIYTADPEKDKSATKFEAITFEVFSKKA